MEVKQNKQWNEFLNSLKRNGFNKTNVKLITKAWYFVIEKHQNQLRRSGEPYVFHLLATAQFLFEWGMETETIVSGLLHDVLEDTDASYDLIKDEFSQDIANIVLNVTKASKLSAQTRKDMNKEVSRTNDDYVINILLSVSSDIRILTVKIADRLHNIRTIEYLSHEKQMRIAQETFNIYAALAGRIGMYSIKTELLDLSFAVLNKERYELVKNKLDEYVEKKQKCYKDFVGKLQMVLNQNNVEFELKERIKGIHSTSIKLQEKTPIWSINDIFAIRLILKGNEIDCFKVLGIIHLNFKTVSSSFKDYISKPKGNLYQSLHTVIIHETTFIEVQIRTEMMDEIANYGIASHWKYKQQKDKIKVIFSDIIDKYDSQDNATGIKELTVGKLIDVFVTNNELTYSISSNWTVLDIAYHVNIEKFPYLISPILKGIKISLSKRLLHNQIVTLEYSNNFTINKNWLKYCNSSETKAWVNNFLDKTKVEQNEIAQKFYSEIANILGDKYVGDETFKIRIIELDFNDVNELLAYLYNSKNILKEQVIDLASIVGRKWKIAAAKIKKIKGESFLKDNLYFNIPDFIHYKKITYPSCCTKAPMIDCVGQVVKNFLIIHNYKCSKINPNEQKYIIPWDKTRVTEGTKIFNVIIQFVADLEKTNDIISYVVSYHLSIKKLETFRVDKYSTKIVIHIGCSSISAGQNILDDLSLNFYISKAKIL